MKATYNIKTSIPNDIIDLCASGNPRKGDACIRELNSAVDAHVRSLAGNYGITFQQAGTVFAESLKTVFGILQAK
jgi:hypothetical protein